MTDKQPVYRYLVTAACLVIVVAGMRAARPLLVPFLLAAFFAVILTPILHWLQRQGVRTAFALLIILGALTLVGTGLLLLVGESFNDFSGKLPEYEKSLTAHIEPLLGQLRSYGIEMPGGAEAELETSDDFPSAVEAVDLKTENQRPAVDHPFDTAWLLRLAQSMLSSVGSLFSNALVIFVTVTFMLLEAARLPAKVQAAFGKSDVTMKHIDVIVGNVRRYVGIKTVTSALTGILVSLGLLLLQVDYPFLLGLLAFLFNFVPNVGSIMAAIPAVSLAFLQAGAPTALGAAGVYLAINCLISYAIEPRFMGQGLGLSTLVVFLSLVFWGWVLGPVGMLLSAPLTMIVKIILDTYDSTRWIAILLSSKPPPLDAAERAA